MKTRAIILIPLVYSILSSASYPQQSITLQGCYELAAGKSAIAGEKDIYNSIRELKERNLSRNWFPSLDVNANMLYNSDIVDFTDAFSSLPIPGIADAMPLMPKDNYKLTLDINQMIFDGGTVRKSKEVEMADMKVNQQQTEAELYKLKGQVNSCYFSIIVADRQKELLKGFLDVLNKRLSAMKSAYENGTILRTDLDVIESERIRTEQQLTDIELRKVALLKVLSDLTGIDLTGNVSLILPSVTGVLDDEIVRPELKLYDLRKEQLDAAIGLLQTQRLPRAFGFATLGYGSPPGNNFFEDGFSAYYVVGAGVKWNIYDWDKVRNEKQQVRLQQSVIEGRKAELTDNLRRSLESKQAEIESLVSAISRDNEIISLRKRITASAESQYENGTITATELLSELNSEKQAEISLEIHRITLEMAKVEYLNICGKEIL